MNKNNIKKLIEEGESSRVEFKESLSLKDETGENVSAFSNTSKGIILVGVSDSGEVKGVQIGKKTIEDLANYIKQHTDNPVYPKISIETIEGKIIIAVEVEESSEKPVFFKSKAYKRIGKTVHKLSASEIRELAKKSGKKSYWDEQICEEASLKDIDLDFVKNFFIPKYESISETKLAGNVKGLLEALGCIRENKPTKAGILLFGKNPQRFFINAIISIARYKGNAVGAERLDYREFSNNLFQQIDGCDKYIKEHTAMMSRLHPGKVEREDIPEYPLFSIRELIVNAIAHRDYAEQGSKIIVKMFDDKTEYYNPGGLQKGINPKNITKKQFSRNPIIAKVLSKVRYIEEVGEGWDKIIEEHKKHHLKPKMPSIIADKYSITVTLFSTKQKFERKELKTDLSERQKKIMGFMEKRGRITTISCATLLGVSQDTALRELTKLKSINLIEKKGTGRGIHYIIK